MYADDTSISFAASSQTDLETKINMELDNFNLWLKANKRSLNVAKIEFMGIGSRQKLQTQKDSTIDIHIEGREINKVDYTKSLGLYIDDNLTWKKHTSEISKRCPLVLAHLRE